MMAIDENIYSSGQYLANNPGWNEEDAHWKAAIIAGLMKKHHISPQTLSEAGCGVGAILEGLSKKFPAITMLTGYDISPQAIEQAAKKSNDRLRFVAMDITKERIPHSQLLLVIDVIEHLEDCFGFVRKLKAEADHFIFHIPLDMSFRTVMKPHVLLQQRQAVGHIHYFTEETALWLLKDNGYRILDKVYTKPVTDVQRPPSLWKGLKKNLRNLSFALNKSASVKLWGNYSIMVLASSR